MPAPAKTKAGGSTKKNAGGGSTKEKAGGSTKKAGGSTNEGGGSTKETPDEQKAMTKKATRILTKKLGRQPTEAEVAKKAKALAKKAAANDSDAEGPMGFGI